MVSEVFMSSNLERGNESYGVVWSWTAMRADERVRGGLCSGRIPAGWVRFGYAMGRVYERREKGAAARAGSLERIKAESNRAQAEGRKAKG